MMIDHAFLDSLSFLQSITVESGFARLCEPILWDMKLHKHMMQSICQAVGTKCMHGPGRLMCNSYILHRGGHYRRLDGPACRRHLVVMQ